MYLRLHALHCLAYSYSQSILKELLHKLQWERDRCLAISLHLQGQHRDEKAGMVSCVKQDSKPKAITTAHHSDGTNGLTCGAFYMKYGVFQFVTKPSGGFS